MTVDAERLTSTWLRSRTSITSIVADRVYTATPENPTFPLMRINQYGGSPVFSKPLYLDRAAMQFDCYGGAKVLARQLADAVRSELAAMVGSHSLGVVTSVEFGEMRYLPDDSYSPAKPRWIVEAVVYSHP